MINKRLAIPALAVVFLLACQFGAEQETVVPEDPVAEVDGHFLTKSDLQGIGRGLPEEDSLEMVQFFVEEWIKEQLLVKKAREMMPSEEIDFSRQVQEYENELILEAYSAELKQKADTFISYQEMLDYYQEQKENYLLPQNLYKVNFVSIPSSSPVIDSIYGWLMDGSEVSMIKIANRAESFSGTAILEDSLWVAQNTVLSWYPVEEWLLESYQPGEVKVCFADGITYLLSLIDKRAEGEPAPFAYKKKEIKGILIAKRKRDFVESSFNKVFEEGKNKKLYTLYK